MASSSKGPPKKAKAKSPAKIKEAKTRARRKPHPLVTHTKLKKDGTPFPSSTGKVVGVNADQTTWRVKLQQSRLKFDDDQKHVYLSQLGKHGMKGRAAEEAGVSQLTVLKHAENDPDFAEARAQATVKYRDKFVDHITDLSLNGVLIEKFNKDGDLLERRQEYPIPLIMMEGKRVEPNYRDKQVIDLDDLPGGVLVVPAAMSPEAYVKASEERVAEQDRLHEEREKEMAALAGNKPDRTEG